ncbi:MAG: hypothetical protein Q3M30_17865 [Candidatus Electrothrix sp. Rat3]|nr:hypothetical protein [Candidatus Electrothrix rattekaaiensis]
MVDSDLQHVTPQDTISSYNSDSSNSSWNGAWYSIDAACTIYIGTIGDYTGELAAVDISSPTEIIAQCGCETVIFGGSTMPCTGTISYTAHLYCNGEQRSEGDTSPCPAPLIDANNLGLPCEE